MTKAKDLGNHMAILVTEEPSWTWAFSLRKRTLISPAASEMSHCSDHSSWPRLFLAVSLLPHSTSGLIGKAPGLEKRPHITQQPLCSSWAKGN